MKWTKEMIAERGKGISPEQFEIIQGTLEMIKEEYFANLDYSENLSTPYARNEAKERAERIETIYRGALQVAWQICNPAQWEELIDKTAWI